MLIAAESEAFQPANVQELPEQLRKELQAPQAEPCTIVRENEHISIVCGICSKQFRSVKEWRIHASGLRKEDGRYTAEQRTAAVETNVLDWCPTVSAAVLRE
uniref:C2H2-type domain-containing protein n=1 Tax=Setaria digitata TaxID=48799 RepID=A0A915Q831_9BILA